MYNSIERDGYPFGTTLLLDAQGHQLSQRSLISWKADQSLLFQVAAQITKDQVIAAYERYRQMGGVVIRF